MTFFVAGVPKSLSVGTSFGFKRGGVEHHAQGRRNTEWAVLVGELGRRHAPPVPWVGGVALTLRFLMPRPKTAGRRVVLPLRRPDLDNLCHKLTDSWNGVFWLDDSQVVDWTVSKRFAEDGRAGVEVTIAPVSAPC